MIIVFTLPRSRISSTHVHVNLYTSVKGTATFGIVQELVDRFNKPRRKIY